MMAPGFIFFYIAVTLIFIAAFRLISLLSRYLSLCKLKQVLPIVECSFWIVYLVLSINYFANNNGQIHVYWAYTVLIILIFLIGRYAFRDIISGIVWRIDNKLKIGDIVKIGNYQGKIVSFNYRNLEIISINEETVAIPYSTIVKSVVEKLNVSEHVFSHSFKIKCSETCRISEQLEYLNKFIISLPWVTLQNEPQIKVVSENESFNSIEITVFSYNQNYLYDIEEEVRKIF